jgi:hypothetical protein
VEIYQNSGMFGRLVQAGQTSVVIEAKIAMEMEVQKITRVNEMVLVARNRHWDRENLVVNSASISVRSTEYGVLDRQQCIALRTHKDTLLVEAGRLALDLEQRYPRMFACKTSW